MTLYSLQISNTLYLAIFVYKKGVDTIVYQPRENHEIRSVNIIKNPKIMI